MPTDPPKCRHFSPEQKAAIVRRHLVDKVHVSDLCDEQGSAAREGELALKESGSSSSRLASRQEGRRDRGRLGRASGDPQLTNPNHPISTEPGQL